MRVMKLVEKDDGAVIFQGELKGQELAFVVEIGLEALIRADALPFTSTENHPLAEIHDLPDMEQ
jgi:hypothetical protein